MTTNYVHVDVFSSLPYSGNSLAVFPDARGLTAIQMLRITQELRHFETVFVEPTAQPTTEDVATGSAAGTIGAYRLRHRLTRGGEAFNLKQGQYTGRPSALRVQPEGSPEDVRTVKVGGDVAFVGRGTLDVLP
jgi:predicted PhzF superfamily epimerase YddE/YHI9